jgi:S-DNA-T family DNA segregation ATPase FtsK/SpoIIIE
MARKPKSIPDPAPTNSYQLMGPDFSGVFLLLFCIIIALALFGVGPGFLNEGLATLLRWLIGISAYPLTFVGMGVSLLMIFRHQGLRYFSWARLLVGELLLLCLLGIVTLVVNPTLGWQTELLQQGGGVIGRLIATLVAPLGTGGGIALLSIIALLLLPKLFNVPMARIEEKLRGYRNRVDDQAARLRLPPPPKAVEYDEPVTPVTRQSPVLTTTAPTQSRVTASTTPPNGDSPKKEISSPLERFKKAVADKIPPVTLPVSLPSLQPASKGVIPTATVPKVAPRYDMPALDLLQKGGAHTLDPNTAREKARIIEETLRQFQVPATVIQVNQGPAVTQFGIQPGFIEITRKDGTVEKRKIKVNAITSLADDLALALSAKSIRVEAPVPGRPYVGIEVPNSDTEMVTLHSVLVSEEFTSMKSDLRVALGRDVSGNPVAADLTKMPHLLIAGSTGSGKSVCINVLILSLLFRLSPDQLKVLMIDPKMVELIQYNGIPHLIAPVVTETDKVVGALTWAQKEMDRRYKLFSEVGKRNHEAYNEWARANGKEVLPYIVIIIDELADLMMVAADQVERIICRIAQMARATGMHLILATQRPSVDVVTGLIKANVPARIAFMVATGIDSRVILDSVGAESLLGRGDMLYQSPDSSKMARMQGCFVSDNEVQRVVEHWLRAKPIGQTPPPTPPTPIAWEDLIEDEAESGGAGSDDLLDKAIDIVRESQWASTSFLQRKLRIGYTRAARLMDIMEERGVIGPPEGNNGSSRKVLLPPPEAKAAEEIEG